MTTKPTETPAVLLNFTGFALGEKVKRRSDKHATPAVGVIVGFSRRPRGRFHSHRDVTADSAALAAGMETGDVQAEVDWGKRKTRLYLDGLEKVT